MPLLTPRRIHLAGSLFLLLILPVGLLAAAVMIHVASEFGFTALGKPAVIRSRRCP